MALCAFISLISKKIYFNETPASYDFIILIRGGRLFFLNDSYYVLRHPSMFASCMYVIHRNKQPSLRCARVGIHTHTLTILSNKQADMRSDAN
jgi:hypothetical protein